MKLEGQLKKKFETQNITASFQKREFVITTQEQYPQDILLELTQDKVTLLDKYNEGDLISVDINVRGREWINPEGVAKYFNTLQAWSIWELGKEGNSQSSGSAPGAPKPPKDPLKTPPALQESKPVDTFTNDTGNDEDDLPF